jgi:hypothetical protein
MTSPERRDSAVPGWTRDPSANIGISNIDLQN